VQQGIAFYEPKVAKAICLANFGSQGLMPKWKYGVKSHTNVKSKNGKIISCLYIYILLFFEGKIINFLIKNKK
jgi:hypothetical protein